MLRTSLLLCLAVIGLGCSTKSSTSVAAKYRIGVVPKGTTHDHWKAVRAGALQAAQELGGIEIL
jgi:ABC-type sugar transport system substrate-binding protein